MPRCVPAAVATKCLREVGHEVVVFEKSDAVGGVWKYDASAESPSSVLYEVSRRAIKQLAQTGG